MKKINDDLFGEIKFDLYWSGKKSINMFGKKYDVILSIDGEEDADFSPIQPKAYTRMSNGRLDLPEGLRR